MLADKGGILLTRGILQQHRVSDYHRISAAELNSCLTQEKEQQELQTKVPNNSRVCGVM